MYRHWLLAMVSAIVSISTGVAGTSISGPADRASPPSPKAIAAAAYHRMGPAKRVGQLFMAGVSSAGVSRASLQALRADKIGNVILTSNTAAGRSAVDEVTAAISPALRHARVGGFISTDQEGGEVQRLAGAGFATIPSALSQGQLAPSVLQADSAHWGKQLRLAGVNLDLAPVADTVPAKNPTANQPIGAFHREYGHTPKVVARHVVPVVKGLTAAGVDATVKHFPGLGRATGNTDTTAGVTDPTTRHGRYVRPYAAAVNAGAQFVMVSSATYPNIDPHHPACFSATIIRSMLRGDLSFAGVVISDDLNAAAFRGISPQRRAVDYFAAGGTMLLDTAPGAETAMIRAVSAKARSGKVFARRLKSAELTVLLAKAKAGLIS